ncbi:hypothetical protein Plo01_37790 [Planobispora longispora]|uniref:Uncharacterized protein n=1 Tax=Planobispora longispora TaxID=28887 RepID=A0A8J3RMG4_9ACTN|nr:hypothetical protein GCM10020093_060910 [Planobispora longispora]GIH77350.1 hypothetical protein Plo01_37790 [Planobispora longispora]
MATRCGEPAAPAADISETAPQAAVRRVRASWSVRVTDMVVHSFESDGQVEERTDGGDAALPVPGVSRSPGPDRPRRSLPGLGVVIAEPLMASTIAGRSDTGPSPP